MRVLALRPGKDWRDAVLAGKSLPYDQFMAEAVTTEAKQGSRILVYCGQNHAFTRYHQPELTLAGKPRSYFDRMGNLLWRRTIPSPMIAASQKRKSKPFGKIGKPRPQTL